MSVLSSGWGRVPISRNGNRLGQGRPGSSCWPRQIPQCSVGCNGPQRWGAGKGKVVGVRCRFNNGLLRGAKRELVAAGAGAGCKNKSGMAWLALDEYYKVEGLQNELGRWVKRAAINEGKNPKSILRVCGRGTVRGMASVTAPRGTGGKEGEVRSNKQLKARTG